MSAWVDARTAAQLLCIGYPAFKNLRRGLFPIEWRPNSQGADARGCGLLLLRTDVESVARIRKDLRCSARMAMRIYDRYGAP